MATSNFSPTIAQPTSRRSTTTTTTPFFRPSPKLITKTKSPPPPLKVRQTLKWVVRQQRDIGRSEQSLSEATTFEVQELVDFLYENIPHVFDDHGMDGTAYDEHIKYRDPITKHDSKTGYLFNTAMLRKLFGSHYCQLHWVKQTGPYEITTRWTVTMRFLLLPWKPELVFTGTSVMGINPETRKFCSHVDYWDSIQNNDYFSVEGLLYVVKQLWYYKTPDLETPKYQILKKTADYEVRSYDSFIVVETNGDKLSGSSGFSSVVGLPAPNQPEVNLRKVEGGIAAVSKFNGKPIEDIVREKEKALRANIIKNGLKPKTGYVLARYNNSGRTWNFIMRNEVLIWLEEFSLD